MDSSGSYLLSDLLFFCNFPIVFHEEDDNKSKGEMFWNMNVLLFCSAINLSCLIKGKVMNEMEGQSGAEIVPSSYSSQLEPDRERRREEGSQA